jgi:short-subunit dehydrogenase
VGLVARSAEPLEALVDKLGCRAHHATADVTRPDQVESAIAQLQERLGPCELLVANAGIGLNSSAVDLDLERIRRVFSVNVDGVMNSVHAVLPGMIERSRGHLVVVSSVAGYRGLPGSGAYSASKAAISNLFEAWRLDLVGSGVAVTIVEPGFIDTPMTQVNQSPMPFMVSCDSAARTIADGIERGRTRVVFPWQMALLMRVSRLTPNWLYDRLLGAVFKGQNFE